MSDHREESDYTEESDKAEEVHAGKGDEEELAASRPPGAKGKENPAQSDGREEPYDEEPESPDGAK